MYLCKLSASFALPPTRTTTKRAQQSPHVSTSDSGFCANVGREAFLRLLSTVPASFDDPLFVPDFQTGFSFQPFDHDELLWSMAFLKSVIFLLLFLSRCDGEVDGDL